MGIIMDYMRFAVANGRPPPSNRLLENPLTKFLPILRHSKPVKPEDVFWMAPIEEATLLYSIASIANYSAEPIENIKLCVESSVWSAPVELIGWSNLPQSVEATQKEHTHHITIGRLEPGQSVEVVFRGHKLVRPHEVTIASAWTFDKTKVAMLMSVILLLTVVLYYGDILTAKLCRLGSIRRIWHR